MLGGWQHAVYYTNSEKMDPWISRRKQCCSHLDSGMMILWSSSGFFSCFLWVGSRSLDPGLSAAGVLACSLWIQWQSRCITLRYRACHSVCQGRQKVLNDSSKMNVRHFNSSQIILAFHLLPSGCIQQKLPLIPIYELWLAPAVAQGRARHLGRFAQGNFICAFWAVADRVQQQLVLFLILVDDCTHILYSTHEWKHRWLTQITVFL